MNIKGIRAGLHEEISFKAGIMRQDGGMTVAAACLFALMLITGLLIFDVANVYVARARAKSAADAAAKAAGMELTPLFGVGSEPERAAREYAQRHGCRLEEVSVGEEGRYRWVQVKVARKVDSILIPTLAGEVHASARCYLDLQAMTAPAEHATR